MRAAARAGLDVVALTDHDTTDGWSAAQDARPAGLTVVPGMELSCRWFPDDQPPISVHLLAYLFDPDSPALSAERARLREAQRVRASLAVGQRVMTTSGLHGTVSEIDDADDTVLLEIAPGVQVRWAAAAVARVLEPTGTTASGSG